MHLRRILPCSIALLLAPGAIVPAAAMTNEEGRLFLEANSGGDGVYTLASGLQYKKLTKGHGPNHPAADAPCVVSYEGRLLDGTVFESREEVTVVPKDAPLEGWTIALQRMVEGDRWELYLPSELGYGGRDSPEEIRGGEVLVFTMELIEIQGDVVPKDAWMKDMDMDMEDTKEHHQRIFTMDHHKHSHGGSDGGGSSVQTQRPAAENDANNTVMIVFVSCSIAVFATYVAMRGGGLARAGGNAQYKPVRMEDSAYDEEGGFGEDEATVEMAEQG